MQQIDGRTAFEGNNKERKLIKIYKLQKDAEGHDCLHPEGKRKKKVLTVNGKYNTRIRIRFVIAKDASQR